MENSLRKEPSDGTDVVQEPESSKATSRISRKNDYRKNIVGNVFKKIPKILRKKGKGKGWEKKFNLNMSWNRFCSHYENILRDISGC